MTFLDYLSRPVCDIFVSSSEVVAIETGQVLTFCSMTPS